MPLEQELFILLVNVIHVHDMHNVTYCMCLFDSCRFFTGHVTHELLMATQAPSATSMHIQLVTGAVIDDVECLMHTVSSGITRDCSDWTCQKAGRCLDSAIPFISGKPTWESQQSGSGSSHIPQTEVVRHFRQKPYVRDPLPTDKLLKYPA